jgi:prophage DNA circulation protein
MSYKERLEPLVYTSPKRKRFTLEFDSLVRQGAKKAGINEYPYQDLANVQDLGNTIQKFPITCYITGQDYDREADRLHDALRETGRGILDHPRWGTIDVLPISFEQTEQFVEGMGRAVFNIEFVEYPEEDFFLLALVKSAIGLVNQVLGAIEIAIGLVDSARRFVQGVQSLVANTIAEVNRVKGRVQETVDIFRKSSKSWTDRVADTRNAMTDLETKFNRNLDSVAGEPFQLLQEVNGILSFPSRIQNSIQQKIDSYKTVIDNISKQNSQPNTIFDPYEASLQGAILITCGIYVADCTFQGEIQTRQEAINICQDLVKYKNIILNEIDRLEGFKGTIDYEALKGLWELYSVAQNRLLSEALNLPSERIITLEKDTPILIVAWNLYGNIDNVDFLIDYNRLVGLENMIVKQGSRIRYI